MAPRKVTVPLAKHDRTVTRVPDWRWFIPGCLGVAWQVAMPLRGGFGHGWEMLNIARSLAHNGTFANPFGALPTGPTAMEPPGFPFVLSLFVRVFGDGTALAWSAALLCILASGLYVSLLPGVSERLLGDRRIGHAAALLAVVLPAFPYAPQWDASVTASLFLTYLIAAQPGPKGLSRRTSFGVGAFAGFLSLWNPITSLAAGLRVLWLAGEPVVGNLRKLGTSRRDLAAALRPAGIVVSMWLVGYFAVAGLWQARNYAVLGTWSPRTNLGTTLYVSNNDCAQPSILGTIDTGCYDRNHPNKSIEEARLITSLGEPAYDRKRTREALAWMVSHPGRFAWLTLARWRDFWLPETGSDQFPYAEAVWITTLLSLVGFLLMRAPLPGWTYMIAVSIVVPLPYYIVVADIRYRTPIIWIAQIAAGYALIRTWEMVREKWTSRNRRSSPSIQVS
jgi:hypothetical protein